jgi:preprotein translocase subunit SecY
LQPRAPQLQLLQPAGKWSKYLATSSATAPSLASMGRLKELRQRIMFLIGALIVFRLGSFIPVPGINPKVMLDAMEQSRGGIVDLFNMFSGGSLGRFSLFALGVMPYISSSIVVQLMATAVPQLQALRKEGESGRRKINQYTRYGAVLLAVIQSFGIATAANSGAIAQGAVANPGVAFIFTAVISLTAGTLFLMWLGEQITERGIGNGISMLIFAGIVAGMPGAIGSTLEMANKGSISYLTVIFLAGLAMAVTGFVVYMERAQRRITINYASRGGGRQAYVNQSQHLPLKLNMSGVIPAVFASSLILLPASAANWFSSIPQLSWLNKIANVLSPGEPLYLLLDAILIIGFAFFYTAMVFNSQETAENLKKSGALVPGIRPGKATGQYIDGVLTRLTLIGGLYLVAVCTLPSLLIKQFNVPFHLGGTSLLIVVVVVMDFMAQVSTHLMSHQYDSVLKKANFKGIGRSSGPRI